MANILESFLLFFGVDVDPLIKGSQQVQQKTNEIDKNFQKITESGNKVTASIGGIGKQLLGLGLAYFSVSSIISGLKESLNYTDELAKTSQYLQVNVEDLDAWRGAILHNGGSIQSLDTSLGNLNNTLYETAVRGFSANLPYFRALGISIRDSNGKIKDAISLLPQFADKLSRFNYYKAVSIGKLFGIDPQTVSLLRTGSKNIEELIRHQKELGTVTTQQAEIVRKYKIQQQDTNIAFRALYAVIDSQILPIITKFSSMMEHTAEYLRKHSALIAGALIPIATILGIIAIEAVLASLPFYLIVSAVLLLGSVFAIVFEDIYGYFHGMDTVTGAILEKFPKFLNYLRNFGETSRDAFKLAIELGKVFVATLLTMGDAMSYVVKQFFTLLSLIPGMIKKLLGFENANINVNANTEHVTRLIAQTKNPVLAAQKYNNMLYPATSSISKSMAVNIGEINVQTQATDANQISTSIADSTIKQFKQAASMLDNARV